MNDFIMYYIAIPVFTVTMALECWWIHRRNGSNPEALVGYEPKDTVASLAMGVGYLIGKAAWKVAELPIYFLVYEVRFFQIPPSILSGIVLFIMMDFCYYWYHRFCHESRFMWAAHVNHHSSEHYNLSTALRQSWTSYFTSIFFYLPLALIGFHPGMIGTAALLHLLYQYWIHTEAIGKMGILESILMTPSHHRVHHATNPQYLDRNHGGFLIVWDKLFGSFQEEIEEPTYGITKNIKSFNLLTIAFHEYRDIYRDVAGANSLQHAFGYIFMPPGWKPQEKNSPPPSKLPSQSR